MSDNSHDSRGDSVKPKNGAWKIFLAVFILLILGGAAFAYWYFYMRGIVYSDDARIDGDLVDMAPAFGGIVGDVNVREGDRVKKGEVVFSMDKRTLAAALLKSQADVVTATQNYANALAQNAKAVHGPREEEIQVAEANMQKAQADAKLAELNWERAKALYDEQVIPASQRDQAQAARDTSQRALQAAQEQLKMLKKGTRKEDLASARAAVGLTKAQIEAAKASVKQASVNLELTDVVAPFDGVVVQRWYDPGASIPAGQPVVTLMNPATLHVSVNLDENDLHLVDVGAPVDIKVDAFPDLHLTGRVEKILRATNSQFSLIPSQGVSGTFIKVAQRVGVRIALDADPVEAIGPGMSVEVRIHTRGEDAPNTRSGKR